MAYTKKTWKNKNEIAESELSQYPRFDAANMNRIEEGIEESLSAGATHISDGTKHITSAEREKWNKTAPSGHGLGTISPSKTISYLDNFQNGGGFYDISYKNDSPDKSSNYTDIIQISRSCAKGNETGAQLAFRDLPSDYTYPMMWMRTASMGKVKDWVEMLHTGNITGYSNKIVTGTYTGDGENSRFIDLKFTPDVVLVFNRCGFPSVIGLNSVSKHYGGLAFKNQGCYQWQNNQKYPIIEIIQNGFEVYVSEFNPNSQGGMKILTNESGGLFYYMAIKKGVKL